MTKNYLEINKQSWNRRTDAHYKSAFYDNNSFIKGRSSLNVIELELLGNIEGKSILHLQCHFGQDSISLARMGGVVTGIDLSDNAIARAIELAQKCGVKCEFICCDLYDLPRHLQKQYDIVFTSYGTIAWLPDLNKWASVVSRFLKQGGLFVFAEFHPAVWMFDDDFKGIKYSYFNVGPIAETETGTYAEKGNEKEYAFVCWNHGLAEVFNALKNNGISVEQFDEYNYSPYDCFAKAEEYEPRKFRIKHLGNRIPMVYRLKGVKG